MSIFVVRRILLLLVVVVVVVGGVDGLCYVSRAASALYTMRS